MKALVDSRGMRLEEFKSLVLEFCERAKGEGMNLVPWMGFSQGMEPSYFCKLPDDMQIGVVERFRSYVEVCREVHGQGQSLRDDKTFLWRMLQKLRLHPPSNLMDQVRESEIIEVHTLEFVQIYRNLRFFEICGYTIDDILSRPFWELLQRDQGITSLLIDLASTTLSGSVHGVLDLPQVPEHTVLELDSAARHLLVVRQRLMAPLRDAQGKTQALATFITCISCVSTAGGVGEYGS